MAPRLALSLPLAALLGACAPDRPAPLPFALAVIDAGGRAAAAAPWPGFDLAATPVAVWDGRRTWLARHPAPDSLYLPWDAWGRPEVSVREGRDPRVRANTSVAWDGVETATLVVDTTEGPPARWGALVLHEAFHVHQRARHPSWMGNEAVLFTYPVDDTDALALARVEEDALRGALDAPDRASAACGAFRFLEARRARFERVGGEGSAYERGTELNEGLATYLEARGAGRPGATLLPAGPYPAGDVRERAYGVGAAQAALLDALAAGWREGLAEERWASLDDALGAALEASGSGPSCAGPPLATAAARARADAGRDLAAWARRRDARREAVLASPGWTLRVRFDDPGRRPFPAGFDPLNVLLMAPLEVLHERWIVLEGAGGRVEVLDRPALTRGAGPHPLWNGVAELVVPGLVEPPATTMMAGDTLVVEARGLSARLLGARVERGDAVVTVILGR